MREKISQEIKKKYLWYERRDERLLSIDLHKLRTMLRGKQHSINKYYIFEFDKNWKLLQ
jgi:hypothetical protein